MAASSLPALRPLGVGELLDQAIRLYRRNFLSFIGIIAVVQIPIGLLQLAFSLLSAQSLSAVSSFNRAGPPRNPFTPAFFVGQFGTLIVAVISFVLVQGVATAAMTRAVADNSLGTPTGFVGAYRRIGQSWLPLVGTLFLAGLFSLLLVVWFLVPCVGWATGLGILAFFGVVIIPMIAPIVVLERKSGYRAMRRAWDLTRRRFWPVLGFVALMFLFNLIVVSGPNLLISAIFQGLILGGERAGAASGGLVTAQLIIESLVTLVFSLLYVPLQLIGFTLLYLDLRVRTEGLDLAMLAQDAALPAPSGAMTSAAASPMPPAPQLVAATPDAVLNIQAPQAEGGSLITGRELGYFFVLTLGFGAIYVLLIGGFTAVLALVASLAR